MEIRLTGKRALVTGANSGIGRAIALALAGAGARTGVNYVSHEEAAREVVGEITRGGGTGLALHADIADEEQVAAMFAEIDRAWGGVDILVNNAGIDGERAAAWNAQPEKWRAVLTVNLVGAFLCAREALRRMVAQRSGVVLNITSVHERIPWSGYSAYTASKAGLSMVTQTLAQEAAPRGVRVLALAPGAIQTPINQSVWGDPAQMADLVSKIPMGRLGRPEEIARMVTVLASDVAGYMTGTTVFMDGGMTLYPEFAHGG
jgi:NAD(P)-dependent dehydrogenase (short-subunit alcohol dehydrogenase family)